MVVLPACARWLLLGEAIAAVDGPILAGPEGDLARGAAACTNRVVHLAGAAVAAASSMATAIAPGLPAGRAALGVFVATTGVELLVVHAEGELGAALGTGEGTIFVGHSMTSLLSRSPRLCAWDGRVSNGDGTRRLVGKEVVAAVGGFTPRLRAWGGRVVSDTVPPAGPLTSSS